MTTAPRLVPAPARPPGTLAALAALLAKEARQSLPLLLIVIGGMLLFNLVVLWRGPDITGFLAVGTPGRNATVVLMIAVPFLWLLKADWQLRGEYAHNTQTLLATLPVPGGVVVLAKYLWVLAEVIVLALVVTVNILIYAGLETGWSALTNITLGGVTYPLNLSTLTDIVKIVFCLGMLLAAVPAITLFATTVGRVARHAGQFVSFVVLAGTIWLYVWLHDRLQTIDLDMPGVALRVIYTDTEPDVFGLEYLVLSVAFTGLMLFLAGKLFDRSDG